MSGTRAGAAPVHPKLRPVLFLARPTNECVCERERGQRERERERRERESEREERESERGKRERQTERDRERKMY